MRLFGGVSIYWDGQLITDFATRKVPALFIYLLLNPRQHSRDEIAGIFWEQSSEKDAKSSLRQAIHNLRQRIPNGVISSRSAVGLNHDISYWVDIEQFKQCEGKAFDLYSGPFMAGFFIDGAPRFESWMLLERQQLNLLTQGAMRAESNRLLAENQIESALRLTTKLATLEPLDEDVQQQLLRLLVMAGQSAAAIKQYEQFRQHLDTELGIIPMASTRLLQQRILRHREQLLPQTVPSPSHPLVGRDDALTDLGHLMLEPQKRLVSILGMGGSGKTHLLLTLLHRWRARFLDGAFFVPLETVNDESGLLAAIAQAVDFSLTDGAQRLSELQRFFRNKEILLGLDNFEQLVGNAGIIQSLLTHAPELKIIITTRQPLRLQAEQLYPLSGLTLGEGNAALSLFEQRAKQANAAYDVQSERPHAIALCKLVDGLPLALMIAASQIEHKSPATILREMRQNLDVLSTDWQDFPERQRNLLALFHSSWQGLSDGSRRVLAKLSVFSGGFNERAAKEIVAAQSGHLNRLRHASLLQLFGDRYSLHPIVRHYAARKLAEIGDEAEIRAAHTTYFSQLLLNRLDELTRSQDGAIKEVAADIDNVKLMWRHAISSKNWSATAISIAPVAFFYDYTGRWTEFMTEFNIGLELMGYQDGMSEPPDNPILGPILMGAGVAAARTKNLPLSQQRLQHSLILYERYGFEQGIGYAELQVGINESFVGNFEKAGKSHRRALAIAKKIGDKLTEARAFYRVGEVEEYLGNYNAALTNYHHSRKIYAELDEHRGLTASYFTEVQLWLDLNQPRKAYALGMSCLGLVRNIKSGVNRAQYNLYLGQTCAALGYAAQAESFLQIAEAAIATQFDESIMLYVCLVRVDLAVQENDLPQAFDRMLVALDVADQLLVETPLLALCLEAANYFEALGDVENAGKILRFLRSKTKLEASRIEKIDAKLAEYGDGECLKGRLKEMPALLRMLVKNAGIPK